MTVFSGLATGLGYSILVWVVGILAMVLSVIAFQFKHRVTIVVFNFLGQSCWVLYFVLQADYASAVSCGLCAVMLAIFAQKERWRWATGKPVVILFSVIICGFSLLAFASWLDIFPLLAGFFCVVANSRSTEKRLRQFSTLWCLSWLINSTLKVYPVAFANDLLCTISTVVSLIRYREKKPSLEER